MHDANGAYPEPHAAPPSNGLGLAGFILSLVGLLSCGLLTPLGVLFSLIGLRREPRGFAIAGTVIGLVGLCGWAIPIAIFGTAFFGLVLGLAGLSTPDFETEFELGIISGMVEEQHKATGSYPSSISSLGIPFSSWTVDPWGNAYHYAVLPDGSGFELSSNGPDGVHATADDVIYTP
ncbi:MAG: hypothetical protein Tsb0013_24510 [Phycisphaerales bacterium]